MLTIIWRAVNMICIKERRHWRFLSICRMMALLSCLPLGEDFWPFIKIPRPFHCLPSGCCHWRMNLGPLRRTDFWNLWRCLPLLCFLKSPTYECGIERGHLPGDSLHMKEHCGSIISDKVRVCCSFCWPLAPQALHTHTSLVATVPKAVWSKYPSWGQDLAPPNCLQAPVLDTSHQTVRQEQSPACQQTGCLKLYEAHRHLKTHTCCGPAYQREKTQHHPPDCRRQSLPLGRQHKLWTNLTQEGTDNRSKGNCDHRQ